MNQAPPIPSTQRESKLNLSPLHKSAILLIALGVERAAKILQHLKEDEVEKISIEIARLQNVSPEALSETIEEFYEMIQVSQYIVQGDISYARQMLEAALGKKKAEELIKRVEAAIEVSTFYLLQTVDDKQLVNFLQNEHPQTAALILANLKPRQAATILSEMPEELQYEIAYRVATMEKTSPELIEDIETVLREQLGSVFGGGLSKTGGVERMAEILNSVSRKAEKVIMERLRERDPELATEITDLMFTFDDLVHLPGSAIQAILKEADSKTIALALKAADPDLKELILKNMSERAAKMLKEELDYLGAVRVKEVEEAQKAILDIARKLEEQGQISLMRGEDEQLLE